MKLYILSRLHTASYDEARAMVIRAKSPMTARKIASQHRGDEGSGSRGSELWLNSAETSCTELKADGPEEMIIWDFYEA